MDDARHAPIHDSDCDGSWVEREALARAAGTPLPKRGGRRREVDMPGEDEVRAAVRTLIRWTGDNPEREGLVDTPDRVMRSYREMYAGYDVDPREYLERTFEEVGGYDELIVLKDIRFVSVCEHHMLPVIGKAHVAYLPTDRVVRLVPGALTPRRVMQLCSASMTTPTPCGCSTSWMARAISAVIFSWICSRRA